MKSQILFSGKKIEKYFKMSAENFTKNAQRYNHLAFIFISDRGSEMDPITCLENTYFLIVFIVLLILSILSFGTALCFCCLFRQRRNESKSRNLYGFYIHRKRFD